MNQVFITRDGHMAKRRLDELKLTPYLKVVHALISPNSINPKNQEASWACTNVVRSSRRFEYPHSLSYQAMILKNCHTVNEWSYHD